MVRVRIDQLSTEITNALKEYTTEVELGLERAKRRVTNKGARTLKETSPKATGNYAAGWRVTDQDGARIIHNATRGSLTHLLENGHALRKGGRTRAFPHIAPVERTVVEEFEKAVEKVIKG